MYFIKNNPRVSTGKPQTGDLQETCFDQPNFEIDTQ